MALKTEGDLEARCKVVARRCWFVVLPLVVLVSVVSFRIQPLLLKSFEEHPWGWVFPAVSAGCFLAGPVFLKRQQEQAAFLSSCGFILGLLCSAAMGLYPNLLPSNVDVGRSLTVTSMSAAGYGLQVGLIWFVPAFALALAYSGFVYRHFAGKVGFTDSASLVGAGNRTARTVDCALALFIDEPVQENGLPKH